MKCFIFLFVLLSCSVASLVRQIDTGTAPNNQKIFRDSLIEPFGESLPILDDDAFEIELNERIINGNAARAGQFPYQVFVRIFNGNVSLPCGGSILSNSWVLTAAHCTRMFTQVTMRFGSNNIYTGGISRSSTRVIPHPNFNQRNLNNDISLVHVPTPLPFGNDNAIRAIRLPTRSQETVSFDGVLATVSGWGQIVNGGPTQIWLRWVNVRVIANKECSRVFGAGRVTASVICTVGHNGVQGVCGGDSGGPLTISEGGVNTLIGTVAFTSELNRGGCTAPQPHGYMRVSSYLTWINEQTRIPIRN